MVTHLGDLHLLHEPHAQVLQHDAVRDGKEAQDMLDEVLLSFIQTVPVRHVAAQVHLLGCSTCRLVMDE